MTLTDAGHKRSRHFRRVMFCAWVAGAWASALVPRRVGVGGSRYPQMLQTGESFNGHSLHDRQYPHDLFMEMAALYTRAITPDVAIELYLAPSGEPALGPSAKMHRPSAMDNSMVPFGHHWQDGSHVSFGVATAGVFTRKWKFEGSIFNGRDPDKSRWDAPGWSFDVGAFLLGYVRELCNGNGMTLACRKMAA